MRVSLKTLIVGAALSVLAVAGAAQAAWPERPVTIIVPAGAGGGTDFTSRMIAQGLTGALGQQFIVENRTSAVITGEIVARAAPDGRLGHHPQAGPRRLRTRTDPFAS